MQKEDMPSGLKMEPFKKVTIILTNKYIYCCVYLLLYGSIILSGWRIGGG